jgi:putative tryptophan/tyrosine transport system substrate-binding protein
VKHRNHAGGRAEWIGRRDLIAMLGGAIAWPKTIWAATAPPHVAFLAVGFGAGDTAASDAIRETLRSLGEVEGQTYVPEVHAWNGMIPQLAAQLVAAKPAVIVAITATAVSALVKLTQTIPIVVAFLTGDPAVLGFSTSVARPTGNVTGLFTLQDVLLWKKVELLGSLVGPLKRVGLLYQVGSSAQAILLEKAKSRANAADPEIVPLGISSSAELSTVFDREEARDIDGLVVAGGPMIGAGREALIAGEIAHRLGAVHDFSFEAEAGALASYGPEPAENLQRAAEYTARLLHGANIADLPFESPRTIRLSLNMRTARALGLAIPPTLLAIADNVIE